MSAGGVRAKIAAKVRNLPSVRFVYSADETTTVSPWPMELVDDGPHALVGRGATLRQGGTGNQRLIRAVDVEFRFSALASDEAQRLIDTLEDEVVVEFSSGITLDGTVIDCVYVGSDRPFLTEDDVGQGDARRPWWVWVTHFEARERWPVEMTP